MFSNNIKIFSTPLSIIILLVLKVTSSDAVKLSLDQSNVNVGTIILSLGWLQNHILILLILTCWSNLNTMDTCWFIALFHTEKFDKFVKSIPFWVLITQSIRVVPTPQLMVPCPLIDTHPSLLGCVPLNTFDLIVVYDKGEIRLMSETATYHDKMLWKCYTHSLPLHLKLLSSQLGYCPWPPT